MMLYTKVKFHKIKLDLKKFRKSLDAKVLKLFVGAIKEFVLNTYPHVPVQTGMARSSLLPLAKVVNVVVPINPQITTPWATRRLALGPLLGKQGSNIKDFIIINRNQYGPYLYTFSWYTNVEHWGFLESESHPRVASAPWYAVAKGTEAMKRYLDQHSDDLPHVTDFLIN